MLFTRFSFRREKLSVARLQREVAQSKSEGTMVSCGNRLLCDSYFTASVQALGPFRLAEDEHPNIKAVVAVSMGASHAFVPLRKLKALSWLLGKAAVAKSCSYFPADGAYWIGKQGKQDHEHRRAISDQNAIDLVAC